MSIQWLFMELIQIWLELAVFLCLCKFWYCYCDHNNSSLLLIAILRFLQRYMCISVSMEMKSPRTWKSTFISNFGLRIKIWICTLETGKEGDRENGKKNLVCFLWNEHRSSTEPLYYYIHMTYYISKTNSWLGIEGNFLVIMCQFWRECYALILYGKLTCFQYSLQINVVWSL